MTIDMVRNTEWGNIEVPIRQTFNFFKNIKVQKCDKIWHIRADIYILGTGSSCGETGYLKVKEQDSVFTDIEIKVTSADIDTLKKDMDALITMFITYILEGQVVE